MADELDIDAMIKRFRDRAPKQATSSRVDDLADKVIGTGVSNIEQQIGH